MRSLNLYETDRKIEYPATLRLNLMFHPLSSPQISRGQTLEFVGKQMHLHFLKEPLRGRGLQKFASILKEKKKISGYTKENDSESILIKKNGFISITSGLCIHSYKLNVLLYHKRRSIPSIIYLDRYCRDGYRGMLNTRTTGVFHMPISTKREIRSGKTRLKNNRPHARP